MGWFTAHKQTAIQQPGSSTAQLPIGKDELLPRTYGILRQQGQEQRFDSVDVHITREEYMSYCCATIIEKQGKQWVVAHGSPNDQLAQFATGDLVITPLKKDTNSGNASFQQRIERSLRENTGFNRTMIIGIENDRVGIADDSLHHRIAQPGVEFLLSKYVIGAEYAQQHSTSRRMDIFDLNGGHYSPTLPSRLADFTIEVIAAQNKLLFTKVELDYAGINGASQPLETSRN